ncbi:hypothetical protein V6N13_054982 [Hibiscus sabdariffa]|uniref:START domain-containing protein n=1 Tax=Hibiscus sabdariffa TaxID=183260 RepID=A0ABR2DWQ5_9ROSI
MGVNIWGCDDGKMGDASSMEIWWLINIRATLIAIIFITISHFSKKFYVRFLAASTSSSSSSSSSLLSSALNLPSSPNSRSRIPEIVNNSDLKFLIDNLDEKCNEEEKWENVIDKKNNFLSYRAKCCKPKDRPLKYVSTTIFESCSPDLLRDFYMDNDYRKQWDKTVIDHMQLQVDTTTGIEIGRTVKKFPLLTPREYILAWRLWEGKDKSFYCFIKECDHPSAPRQKKYVRVEYFRSVPGRDASEIRMFHQEDAGLNVEMAKLAFARGIWSYLCKMDNALHNYSTTSHLPTGSSVSAVTLIRKVPPELDRTGTPFSSFPGSVASDDESRKKRFLRRPSKTFVAKSLLLIGGVMYLVRAHSALGGKVTVAYILRKLRKHGSDSSSQSNPS